MNEYECVETTESPLLWLMCVLVELWIEEKINDDEYSNLMHSIQSGG